MKLIPHEFDYLKENWKLFHFIFDFESYFEFLNGA